MIIDYRALLREELLQRVQSRRSYSSNALARDLGLSKGFLSQVLSGKRKLSGSSALAVSNRLAWSPKKQKLFLDLVRYELIGKSDGKEVLWNEIEKQLGQSKFL